MTKSQGPGCRLTEEDYQWLETKRKAEEEAAIALAEKKESERMAGQLLDWIRRWLFWVALSAWYFATAFTYSTVDAQLFMALFLGTGLGTTAMVLYHANWFHEPAQDPRPTAQGD